MEVNVSRMTPSTINLFVGWWGPIRNNHLFLFISIYIEPKRR